MTSLAVRWLRLQFHFWGHRFHPWSGNHGAACNAVYPKKMRDTQEQRKKLNKMLSGALAVRKHSMTKSKFNIGELKLRLSTGRLNLCVEKESEVAQSCPTLCNPLDCSLPGSSLPGIFQARVTRVGCHFLLQGIFPTQGSNPGLPHCRQMLYYLSHQVPRH